MACGRLPNQRSPEQVRLLELDAWQCRDEFFSVPDYDAPGFTQFLNKIGVWSSDPESASLDWARYPLYVHLDDIMRFRQDLRDALLNRERFTASVTPVLRKPNTLLDLMAQSNPANEFPLRFELTKVAAGVVTVTNGRSMLIATVLADIARGLRFKMCKRKDCQKPFPLKNRHKRDYCSHKCAHLVSVRRGRKKHKKAGKSLR
jgi:hypothetical protein